MRRNGLWLVSLFFICLAANGALAQQDFTKVQIRATKVSGNIYMLEGAGGNIGVSAGEDGLLIVDDQFAPLADKIRAALKQINPGALRFVLNTHYHGDHTGSNAVFGKEATIIAQDNVRARLVAEQTLMGEKVPPAPKEALPVITYAQSVSVYFNGEEIKVMHYPHGHTDGDSVIFFTRSNVVHMGDDFFAGRFPFVDLEHGGSVSGMAQNVSDILAKLPADVKVIPGHGPLSAKADLEQFRNMLVETSNLIGEQQRAGKTLAQVKAAGLPDKWKTWGTGFINTDLWIETVYNSISKEGKK